CRVGESRTRATRHLDAGVRYLRQWPRCRLIERRGGSGHINDRYNAPVRIVSSAPTRIDLAGGTIDIWPLYLFHDGALTLNAAIAGSSALAMAVTGGLARWTNRSSDPEHLLQVAMNIECRAIRVPAGVQDFRPALYGGIAAIELRPETIKRVAIEVDPRELEK